MEASVLLAGVLATTAMIAVMSLIHRLRWANADMVRAVGSLFSRSYEMSVAPGLLIHYFAGISFALLYSLLISILPVDSSGAVVIVSFLAGLVHGVVFSLLLTILVAEYHPLDEFRETSFGVLVAHGIGHVFYGGTLGVVFAVTHAKLTYLKGDYPAMVVRQVGALLGYGIVWFFLFGMPLLFVGYVAYAVLTNWYRRAAHEADVVTGHESSVHEPTVDDERMAS